MRPLNIITPLSRPENLHLILHSLNLAYNRGLQVRLFLAGNELPEIEESNFEIFGIESQSDSPGGHLHRENALNMIQVMHPDEFVYNLDDDNKLHPMFIKFFLTDPLTHNCYLFSQVFRNGSIRLIADEKWIVPHKVDTAMILFKAKAAMGLSFTDAYDSDGYFIQALYQKNKENFKVIKKPMCYYNYLRLV